MSAELLRRDLCQPHDRELGGAVGSEQRPSRLPCLTCDVDDRSALALADHLARRFADAEHRAESHHVEILPPRFDGELGDRHEAKPDPRVVHHHVEASEALDGAANERRDVFLLRDIREDHFGFSSLLREVGANGVDLASRRDLIVGEALERSTDVRQDDLRSLGGERVRDRFADAPDASSARDDCNLARKSGVHASIYTNYARSRNVTTDARERRATVSAVLPSTSWKNPLRGNRSMSRRPAVPIVTTSGFQLFSSSRIPLARSYATTTTPSWGISPSWSAAKRSSRSLAARSARAMLTGSSAAKPYRSRFTSRYEGSVRIT